MSKRNKLLWGVGAAAGAALAVELQTRRAERQNPPLGRFMEVDGVKLHYLERGSGEPIVFVHGTGTMIEDVLLTGMFDTAAGRRWAIAFDRPGSGYSTRPRTRIWTVQAQAKLLHDATARVGAHRPILVGHSFGALVALAWALDYPADVSALALFSGYYYPSFRADALMAAPLATPVVGDLLSHTVMPFLQRAQWPAVTKFLFSPAPTGAWSRDYPAWMSVRPRQLRASAGDMVLAIAGAAALRPRYHELAVPTLIAAGEDDRFIPALKNSARLHKEVPSSVLTLFPEIGHMLPQTRGAESMAQVDALAARTR